MAKKSFDIGETVGSILKIAVLAIIGFIAWSVLSNKFLKSKKEAQDEESFKQKGFLRSLYDFFAGEGAAEATFPTSTEKEQAQTQNKAEDTNKAYEEALAEQKRLEDLIKERDALADEYTKKTIAASDLSEQEKEKLRQENKRLAEEALAQKAEYEKKLAEAKKKGQSPASVPKPPAVEVNRADTQFKIFRFSKPVTSKSGQQFADFAFSTSLARTKESRGNKEIEKQRKELQEIAIKQVEASGFKLNRLPKGTKEKPITALKESTAQRLEKDARLRASIEASQKRRLGVR